MAKRTGLISRVGVSTLAAGLSVACLGLFFGSGSLTQAAVVEAGKGPQLLIGADDDNQDNVAIQAGAAASQSGMCSGATVTRAAPRSSSRARIGR